MAKRAPGAPESDPRSKKAKGKAKPPAQVQGNAPAVGLVAPGATCINAEFHHMLSQCEQKILNHQVFHDVCNGDPTGDCGTPAYDEGEAGRRLQAGQDYVASCPLFWLNLRYELQPNVPKCRQRIENLKAHFFGKPGPMPGNGITVSHVMGEDLPHKRKGQLRAVCSPELRDALRVAIAEDVDTGDEDKLNAWAKILMSIPFRFKVVQEGHYLSTLFEDVVQQREDIGVLHDNTRMSALLRSYEIIDLKTQLEVTEGTQNKHKLADYYKKIKYSPTSEAVSVTFVEATLTLHNNVLCVPEVRDVCFKFDGIGIKNPMDSVHKYRQIAMGCDNKKDLMVWSFNMTWDWWNRTDGNDSISIRILRGDAAGWGGVSLVKLFINKLTLRNALWKKMDEFNWDVNVKESMKDLTKDVESCRLKLGYHDDPDKVPVKDLADRSLWPESADKFLLLFEVLVYGYSLDVIMIKAMQQKKGVDEFLEFPEVSSYLRAVQAAYARETRKTSDAMSDGEGEVGASAPSAVAATALAENQSVVQKILSSASTDPSNVTDDVLQEAKNYSKSADRDVKSVVKLVSAATSMDELKAAIQKTSACKVVGSNKKHVAIVLDAKRLCAKLLHENDVLIGIDGDKNDFEEKVVKALAPLKLDNTKLLTIYTQDSVEKRLDRPGGSNALTLTETVHLMTTTKFQCKVQPRKLLTGQTTRANVLGPLAHANLADKTVTWTITWAEKKELLSVDNMPLPGGRCEGSDAASAASEKTEKVKPTDLVPAFYHESPPSLSVELAHLVQAVAIIDLTPGSGHWAMHAVRHRIPYCGVCFTEKHVAMLYEKLISRSLDAKLDANDKDMYDASLASIVTKHTKEGNAPKKISETTDLPNTPATKPTPTPKPPGGGASRDALLQKIAALKEQQQ
ncbi:unnamed protein product, partial [Prorocentrum cordatum]